MPLLDLYADRAGQEYDRQLANPGPAPQPTFSLWSAAGAGVNALPAAGVETAGSFADILSSLGTVGASLGGSSRGMFSPQTDAERQQEAEARKRMLDSQSFDFTAGNVLRRKADEFAPDPATSHRADQVVHGIVKFGAKAVTAVSTMGPAAGAAVLGLEEANTTAQRLRVEGVDTSTAVKVGAVQGAFSAAGAVLPVGGSTVMQTLGLAAIGGPGAFMAQEQLSKSILQQAGYNDQASQHDPLDPLGLALSTIIPGGFGALHMRGVAKRAEAVGAGKVPLDSLKPDEVRGLKYDDPRLDAYAEKSAQAHGVPPAILLAIKNAGEKSGPTAKSPAGAVGVMQFMEPTAREMGLKDRTDPVASIDAGAAYLRKLHDSYGSWDAAVAHYNGGGAQAAIVRGGGRPTIPETAAYLDRVQKYVHEHTASEAAQVPDAVDAARVQVLNDTLRSLPDHPDAYGELQKAADAVAEGPVLETVPHPDRMRLEGEMAGIESQRAELLPTAGDLAERGAIRQIHQELALMEQQRPDLSEVAVKNLARQIQADERMSYKSALGEASKRMAEASGDFERRSARLQGAIDRNAKAQQAVQRLGELDARVGEIQRELQQLPLTSARLNSPKPNDLPAPESVSLNGETPPKATEPAQVAGEPPVPAGHVRLYHGGLDMPDATSRFVAPGNRHYAEGYAAKTQGGRVFYHDIPESDPRLVPAFDASGASVKAPLNFFELKGEEARGMKPLVEAGQGKPQSLDAQLAQQAAVLHPDMPVILPGAEEAIPLSEALRRIAQDQADEAGVGELVKVAAQCALSA
jgi:hypothetical protein